MSARYDSLLTTRHDVMLPRMLNRRLVAVAANAPFLVATFYMGYISSALLTVLGPWHTVVLCVGFSTGAVEASRHFEKFMRNRVENREPGLD